MNKPIVYNIDKSLESEHFQNLKLSIQLKLDGFSFSILNIELNKIVALVDYNLGGIKHPIELLKKIKEIYNEDSLLKLSFKEVKIAHVNQISTLIPVALFDDNNLKSYLSFNQKLLENEYITYDIIETHDIANVYSPFTEINDFFFDKYGEFIFKHYSSVLIENIFEINNGNKDLKMYVHVLNNQFEVVVIDNKKLILYNSFVYDTKEDFVYFILFIAEQLKINTEEFELELYGDIEPYSELYALIYKYVRNVSFGYRTDKQEYSHELNDINPHNYFVLLNQ